MFKAIKDNWRKARAATILGNLIQEQIDAGLFPKVDAQQIAGNYVSKGWGIKPDMLSGKFGTRPHDISVAMFCLASVIVDLHLSIDDLEGSVGFHVITFARLVQEIETNGALYGLTETDHVVINMASGSVAAVIEEANEQ